MSTDLELAAEYAAAAEAWQAFAKRPADADPMGEPLAVVLLAGLCEPPPYAAKFTGDLLADVLGGLRGFVDRLDQDAAEGGGARAVVHGPALEAWLRRLNGALALRRYERIHREHLAPTGAPKPGGDDVPRKFAGKPRIKVTILSRANEGMHYATLQVDPQPIYFFAHEDDVDTAEGTMLVSVVENDGPYVYVDLPARTLRTKRRMRIPLEMVIDYQPGKGGAA